MSRKVALIGGGGVRTPLVAFGINESAARLDAEELVLYDTEPGRAEIMARLGRSVVHREQGSLRISVASTLEEAIDGASFVLSSIRVGGMASRIYDERLAIDCGFPGQETTGPGGVAMALRTIPIAIEQARLVARIAPKAWLINFTNPAGLVTQALTQHTGARVVGICDTPTEMLYRIQTALNATASEVECEYVGLNHLGWIRKITLRGEDITERFLEDDALLSQLYSTPLFDHDLIRTLRLIPTEYLFFYYCRRRALENQRRVGGTRGEQVTKLNEALLDRLSQILAANDQPRALQTYMDYLNARSGSYMKLENGSTQQATPEEDPFRAASGYHRIALDVMNALSDDLPSRIIVNTRNIGTLPEVEPNDIVEASSIITRDHISPIPCGPLPESVRGLVLAVKAYERVAIEAAVTGSHRLARKAMLLHPAIGEWEPSASLLQNMLWPPK